ncbi:MAG: hypothetical protein M0Z30_03280 [Actinomycetota bacterium]|nr:hypothetical protein [Actinomycetota bacterium]
MTTGGQERPELEEVLDRAADPEAFEAWQRRAKATGWCRHPVRLTGAANRVDTATGEVIGHFASAGLPDGVLLKACGHRRATRCPTCSATYQADAYQLVAAGLRGGKGVPESIAAHPMVFVTLTAPSFGAVHACRHNDGTLTFPCHPGAGTCRHGRGRACHAVHEPADPLVGQPICGDCFDYIAAVLWNAHAGELWRRTTIAIGRSLARQAGIPRSHLRHHVRLAFTKVAEYQRRGSVHFHAVIRLDAPSGPAAVPPAPFDTALLSAAVAWAVPAVSVPGPDSPGAPRAFRWGAQLDIQTIGADGKPPKMVGGYLAKYATKSTDPDGILDRRLKAADLAGLDQRIGPHLAMMVRTAWDLGGRPELEHLRLRAWAHTLGFRGHWLTKSRAYSTTLTALRAARHQWNLQRDGDDLRDAAVTIGDWRYAGRGWTSDGDAWLAETAASHAADQRRTARQGTRTTTTGGATGDA